MQGRHGGHDAAGSFYHIMSGRKCFRAGYTTKHDKAPSDILFRNVVRCEDIVSIHRGIHMHTASEKTHSRFPAGGLPDVGLVSDRQKSTAHIKRTVQQQLSCGNHSKQIHQIRPGIIPNWISDIILIRFLF